MNSIYGRLGLFRKKVVITSTHKEDNSEKRAADSRFD